MATFLAVLMTTAALICGTVRRPSRDDRSPREMGAAARAAGPARCAVLALIATGGLLLLLIAETFHLIKFAGHCLAAGFAIAAAWLEALAHPQPLEVQP